MSQENLFTTEHIKDIEGFDNHLNYAESLIQKYEWKASVREKFEKQIAHIKQKQNDKLLNLSVVGEFSTGKSTFINAMLRKEDFLVSSALQGTTVAATVIEYANEYAIILYNKNGTVEKKSYKNLNDLRDGIVTCTTYSFIARYLESVKILIPAEPLAAGFRIIDTPGTNANERWHEEITVNTIKEMSDLSIIIVDANKPLTKSFCDFIKANLADVLHQCAFVVTRFDMIRRRERMGILEYMKQKISIEFGISQPLVLPYAAIDMFDYCAGGEETELVQMSKETESRLLMHMMKNKVLAQTQKLVTLIDDMYLTISEQMQLLSDGYQKKLDMLIRSRQAALEPFIQQKTQEHTASFQMAVAKHRAGVLGKYEILANQEKEMIQTNIMKQQSIEQVKSYVDNHLKNACLEGGKRMGEAARSEYEQIIACYQRELQNFQKEFEALFEDLNLMKLDFKTHTYELPGFSPIDTSKLGAASTYISEQIKRENKAFLGGMAAGAAIGTAIAPGVGTVIGGIIGLIGGGAKAPDRYTMKKNITEKINQPLSNYFLDIAQKMVEGYDEYTMNLSKNIGVELNRYLHTYQSTVSKKYQYEKEKETIIKEKLASIQIDLKSIEQRKFSLDSLKQQIKRLSGKEDGTWTPEIEKTLKSSGINLLQHSMASC